jgi:hypothetical protein
MEETRNDKIKEKINNSEEWGFEANQNWLGFWNLLLEEDIKQNPHLYKKPKDDENNRDTNNTN